MARRSIGRSAPERAYDETVRRLLSLLLAGCATAAPPAPIQAPLEIPPLAARPPEPDGLHFAEGAAPPAGCFARSRRTGAVACVTGHFHPHGDGERRLSILENEDAPTAPLDLALAGGAALAEPSRKALNERLGEGEYVALTGRPVRMTVGPPHVFGSFRVALERRTSHEHTGVPTSDLVLDVTRNALPREERPPDPWGDPDEMTKGPSILFNNILSDVVCDVAAVDVRELDTRTILVERECRVGDEIYLAATLCNDALGRCD